MRVRLWSALALLGILMAYGAPGAAASAAPSVKVTTAGSAYLPGSTVTIDGSVQVGGTGVAGVDVALEADGATSGQNYWVDQVTTGPGGSFTDQFVLPQAAAQESAIKILAVAEGGRASTTFDVQTPTVTPSGGGSAGGSSTTCTEQPQGEVIDGPMGSGGGTLTSTDGCIMLTVPEGAFSQQTTITVTESAPEALPPGDEMALTPMFAIDFGEEAPLKPVSAVIEYNPATVGSASLLRIGLFQQDGANFRYIKDAADGTSDTDAAAIMSAGSYILSLNTQTFGDVQEDSALQQELDILLGRAAISGFPDGSFYPDHTVTRAEFVKMLVLSLGLVLPEAPSTDGFTDVDPQSWYAPYVDAAVTAGLVKGVTPETFRPEASITRAQLAVMVVRAMNGYAPASPLLVQFTDQAQIPSWALQDVMAGAEAGIVQGLPDGSFDPAGLATRSQAAAMIGNLVTVTGQ